MSPDSEDKDHSCNNGAMDGTFVSCTKQDCEEAFADFLGRESRYLPQSGYSTLIHIHHLIADARSKAVTWIIKVFSYALIDYVIMNRDRSVSIYFHLVSKKNGSMC